MGDRYVQGFAAAPRFLRSQILCRLYKGPSDEYKPRSFVCIRIQKDRIRSLKILRFVSEFGGLWEHQTNPACSKRCHSLHSIEDGHCGRRSRSGGTWESSTSHALHKTGTWEAKPVTAQYVRQISIQKIRWLICEQSATIRFRTEPRPVFPNFLPSKLSIWPPWDGVLTILAHSSGQVIVICLIWRQNQNILLSQDKFTRKFVLQCTVTNRINSRVLF